MDFTLSEEQRLLCDSLGRLLADRYDFAARRAILASPAGWSEPVWTAFAELGLLGLNVAEAQGGFGGGPVELMLVMQAFGRALVMEPYLASVVLGGTALRAAGHSALLAEMVAGRLRLAWAHGEAGTRHRLFEVRTAARTEGAGWRLDGRKSLVLHGAAAAQLVVSARLHGPAEAAAGLGLFLVAADAPGLHVTPQTLADGSRAAVLSLDGVPATPLGPPGEAAALIEQVSQAGLAAVCAEAVGVMETALSLTVEYLKTRQQFGRPIGQNQALQHCAAEMLIALEQARSMAMLAAMMVSADDATERARALSQAKLQIGRAGRLVGQSAVQLHGGIGVTEEYEVGHALRRLMVIEQLFGDTAHHLGLLSDPLR